MSFFKDLKRNTGLILNKAPLDRTAASKDVTMEQINWTGGHITAEDKQAIYPNWFFSARLGQPRSYEPRTLRNLAQSPWAQMVISSFKKQIYTTEWVIKNKDEDDETDYSKQIKIIKDFLYKINLSGQSIDDLNSEVITDIAEIDSGIWNYVYSNDSYIIGEVPIYDAWGRVDSTETDLVLKPFGQRKLVSVKSVDGSTMLKQVDIYKNLLNYWQYSFKHPRMNPTRFFPEEIGFMIMNKRPYSIYGFSPIQSIQQVLELLIQGTRYNKDLFTNNAIPDLLISLPQLPEPQLKKLKRVWNNQYKGKPHQVGFINWVIERVEKLADSNRDLEWLEGQKWYKKIVFGVFGVSPEEAGFTENSNRATGDSQERVTVRNALKPYYKLIETEINNRLIPELLQDENPPIKFKFNPMDQESAKSQFEQDMQELDHGTMTINEFRKSKGKESVEWGDDPLRRPFDPTTSFTNFGEMPGINNNNSKDKEKEKQEQKFKKSFEVFMQHGRHTYSKSIK